VTDRLGRDYLSRAARAAATRGVRAVLADVGGHLAPGRSDLPLVAAAPDPALAPPAGLTTPEVLGRVYEAAMDPAVRRRRGAFYTPVPVAAALAAATLEGLGPAARVWDPAVGCGALLLAAARVLIGAGADPATVVGGQLGGVDTDPLAVDVAVTALGALAGTTPSGLSVGDGLQRPPGTWDAVIANPPFLAQLKRDTARSREDAAALAQRFGSPVAGYTDDAGLFLLVASGTARPGGRVGFVLPAPLLATRDSATVREAVGSTTSLVRLWSPPSAGFDAGVRVVLVVARAGAGKGRDAWSGGRWAAALEGPGPPAVRLRTSGVVDDVATASADFRDQYYAMSAAAHDGSEVGPGLVTCGLIDPAHLRWGSRPARIGRRSFVAPRAAGLDPDALPWVARRLVPKVMVATQTRVIEAAADPDGRWLPVVPVVSVVPTACDVWSLLAVLLAPAISAQVRRTHAGAALSADAIKLSARQIAALPLPADAAAWAAGAAAARAATRAAESADGEGWLAALRQLGTAMDAAYSVVSADVWSWWWERIARLPRPGVGTPPGGGDPATAVTP
jgi:hypothetical protein